MLADERPAVDGLDTRRHAGLFSSRDALSIARNRIAAAACGSRHCQQPNPPHLPLWCSPQHIASTGALSKVSSKSRAPSAADIDELFEQLDALRRIRVPDAPAVRRSKQGLSDALNEEVLALRMKRLKPGAANAITAVADKINQAFARLGPMGMADYQLGLLK